MGNILNSSSIIEEISESRIEFENIKKFKKKNKANEIINKTVNENDIIKIEI